MSPNDPDVSRLLAAIRRLEDLESRAKQLVYCLHLVPEAERGSTVEEILRGAREIRIIKLKKHLVTRLVTALQDDDDDDWVPSVLAWPGFSIIFPAGSAR